MRREMAESPVFTIDRQDLYGTWHSETPPETPIPVKDQKIRKSLDRGVQIEIPDEKGTPPAESPQPSFCRSAKCKCVTVLACALLAVAFYLLYKRYIYEPPPVDTPPGD